MFTSLSTTTSSVRGFSLGLRRFTVAKNQAAMSSIQQFFALPKFAVVGASNDRSKFGNRILVCYREHGKDVIPINKKEATIEGLPCKGSIVELEHPESVGVSIVTPPAVTKAVIEEGLAHGFRHFFLQPGTYDAAVDAVIQREAQKATFIKSCVLVELGCE
jgi:predicted CoA-binding protein